MGFFKRKIVWMPIVGLLLLVFVFSFFRKADDDPVDDQDRSTDIVEVVPSFKRPRPDVTSIAQPTPDIEDYDEQQEAYPFPWAFPPEDFGAGPCADPYFELVQVPISDYVYTKDDTLEIGVGYRAEGCTEMIVTIAGRHHKGSPFYEYWCEEVVHKQLNSPSMTVAKVNRATSVGRRR
ncbi:MAG: hypothetical protein HY873_04355 [Chloroflexi bacterium]|nr:hypothetical protein [Chloroflexota bacterium]